ncbi:MAG: lipoyl synthase [Phycisphaerales bacterium]
MSADSAVSRTLARHPRPLGGDTARSVGPSLLSLTDRVINNQVAESGAGRIELRIGKKPDWLRARAPGGEGFLRTKALIDEHRLHTVCQEASCPNMGECWSRGAATIMILGDTCTRSCGFCNVKTGRPAETDSDEPRRVAEALSKVRLKHVVVTSVNRDELPDGGAAIWAETIVRVKEACPWMSLECLVGDFGGDERALQVVIDARPHILAHNLETVRRMHPAVRPQARYERSLAVLRQIKRAGLVTKTGIMVGIGEHDDEVLALMDDVIGATEPAPTLAMRTEREGKELAAVSDSSAGRASAGGGEAEEMVAVPNIVRNVHTSEMVAVLNSPNSRNSHRAHGAHGAGTGALVDERRGAGCDILTIGQYLQPTRNHLPVERWVHPDRFAMFKREGLARGFRVVESGPLVRSSYRADEQAALLCGTSGAAGSA